MIVNTWYYVNMIEVESLALKTPTLGYIFEIRIGIAKAYNL